AGAHLEVGARRALGIDAHRAGLDQLLRQRARLDGAGKEQEAVEPLLADRGVGRLAQALLRLVAQRRQRREGTVGVEGAALLARRRPRRTRALARRAALFLASVAVMLVAGGALLAGARALAPLLARPLLLRPG